jgi:hypothetical protein
MDFGIAETGIARGSPPGTTTEVRRVGLPSAEIRFVSMRHFLEAIGFETQEDISMEKIFVVHFKEGTRQSFLNNYT